MWLKIQSKYEKLETVTFICIRVAVFENPVETEHFKCKSLDDSVI